MTEPSVPKTLKERADNGEFCSDKCPDGCVSNEIVGLFARIAALEGALREAERAHELHCTVSRCAYTATSPLPDERFHDAPELADGSAPARPHRKKGI